MHMFDEEEESELEEVWPSELNVLFVGDRPSKHNKSTNVAFLGSKSGVTLAEWIDFMSIEPGNYMAINRVDEFFRECALSFYKRQKPVVALGVLAHKALEKAGIPHFSLPHPSGLNRVLNNKVKTKALLAKCKAYIKAHEEF